MKRGNLYKINWVRMVAMLMTMVGIVACSDEEFIGGTVKEGTPVAVSFQFATPTQELVVSTRAMGEETANKVANLYVIGFKLNGDRAFGFYYNAEDLKGGNVLASKEKIAAGTYEIYAVANIDSDVYGVDENTDNTSARNLKSFLDEVSTKEALLTKTVSILTSARNLDRSGSSLLMAGALCDNGKAIPAIINVDGQTVRTINLKRLDSEITFNFKGGAGVAFTAKRWYAVNAPAKSRLIEDEVVDGATDSGDFFHTYKAKEENRTPVYNNTFTFYMPENRKKAKGETITDYHDREREIKNSDGMHNIDPDTQRRNYVNAPDYGTYVVVTGHYEGPATSTDPSIGTMPNVVAEVQYTIHLGFVKSVANDFFSKRNTKYTYNVTVKGVDNIIVEVEKEEENQPGATGDVIFGDGKNVYTLDAHYETVLLTFDYDELLTAWGDGNIQGLFTAVANTPYSNMIDGEAAEKEDQKWVQVIRNKDASDEFQLYYENEAKLQSVQTMLDELKAAIIAKDKSMFTLKNGKYIVTYTCFVDEFYYEEEDLPSDVRGNLPDNTNIWKSFVNRPNRKMYIICYRKESPDKESSIVSSKYVISQRSIQTFYSTEPTPEQKVIAYGTETLNETGNLPFSINYRYAKDPDYGWANFNYQVDGKINWRKLIEKDNGYKSLEKNEIVNREGNLNPNDPNGKGKESDYLRAMLPEMLLPGTPNSMVYVSACLQRNRRMTNSESVSPEEIKWYLPAINQYQAFYIGEAAVSQEARLFDYPNVDPVGALSYQFIKHYASSNVPKDAGMGNPDASSYIFWAEEATSVSTYNQQFEWATTGGSKNNPEALLLQRRTFSYRCMRNLGSDGADNKGQYDSYRTVTKKQDGTREFRLDKLNPLLKTRGRTTGELGPHFYQDKGNHFYAAGFEVADSLLCNDLVTTLERTTGVNPDNKTTGCEALNKNLGPGEARWRVPNLRELTLMWQEQVINATDPQNVMRGRAAARTRMSYKYKDNWYRKGWTVTNPSSGGKNNLGMSSDNNHATTVRCVRDLK